MTAPLLFNLGCQFFVAHHWEQYFKNFDKGFCRRLIRRGQLRVVERHAAMKDVFDNALKEHFCCGLRNDAIVYAIYPSILPGRLVSDSVLEKCLPENLRLIADTTHSVAIFVTKCLGHCNPAQEWSKTKFRCCDINQNVCRFQHDVEAAFPHAVSTYVHLHDTSITNRPPQIHRHSFFFTAKQQVPAFVRDRHFCIAFCMADSAGTIRSIRIGRPKHGSGTLSAMGRLFLQELGGAMHNLESVYTNSCRQFSQIITALRGSAVELKRRVLTAIFELAIFLDARHGSGNEAEARIVMADTSC